MQLVFIEKNQAGQRLDKFLHKYLPQAGTSFLYKMLRKKNITLNDKKAEGKEILSVGDKVTFFFAEETFHKFCNDQASGVETSCQEYVRAYHTLKGIQVIYEDDNVMFLNKPAGILTQKARPSDLSVNEWLIGYLLAKGEMTEHILKTFHPSVCNRLDRNTSGMVLCGKSLAGSQELGRVIKKHQLHKYYHTICVGQLTSKQDLEGYLIKNPATNKVTVLQSVSDNPMAEAIHTKYKPLSSTKEHTLLEVELITGKTHQIRAHLASIGHPIIGDNKYGEQKKNLLYVRELGLKNQLLHAYRIVFPILEGALSNLSGREFIAKCPRQFHNICQKLQL